MENEKQERRVCPTCDGNKEYMGEPCVTCDGTGYLDDEPKPLPFDPENQLSLL